MTLPDPSVCAVVVSFNPDVSVLVNLARQFERNDCDYIVIDNGSGNFADFADTILSCQHCRELVPLPENLGLAAAINIGLEHVRDAGYRFVMLFDQDSHIGPTYCRDMFVAWSEATALAGDRVAAIGPRLQDPDTGRRTPFREFNRLFSRSDRPASAGSSLYHTGFLITSGTLIPLQVLPEVGPMRDEYFIDNVDLEWCFRARSLGYELYGTDQAVLYHRVGETGEPGDSVLVRRGIMAKHSPLRSYYSTRNRINLYRTHYAPLDWKVRDFCRFVLKSVWLLVFSGQRRDYWRNIRRGISDSKAMT